MSAAREAMDFQRQVSAKLSNELTVEMEKKGVQVNRPDLASFREAVAPVHQDYIGKSFSRELYDLIRSGK
jgi:TRAP-type C4-dicarboxylate transport system substrate-binding protein